jgi:hypothetical protein
MFSFIFAAVLALAIHQGFHTLALRDLDLTVGRPPFGGRNVTVHLRGQTHLLRGGLLNSPYVRWATRAPAEPTGDAPELAYRDAMWYLNAGTVGNLVFGLGVVAVTAGNIVGILAGLVALTGWMFRRLAAAYALPVLAVPAALYVLLSVIWPHPGTAADQHTLFEFIRYTGAVSLLFGLLNLVPLPLTDTARVVELLVRARFGFRAAALVNGSAAATLAFGIPFWLGLPASAAGWPVLGRLLAVSALVGLAYAAVRYGTPKFRPQIIQVTQKITELQAST